ncbi:MAG: MATE family efflux transporter, partial [Muribaculaceae bacterium]|nr:MATE family efflux transporter [Muribaculaceae bacterium]
AMTVQIVAAILNIILDWMMVFPMGMGIKGAAIATSIACIVGGLMVLVYFLFFSDKLKFIRVNVGRSSVFKSLHDVGYMAKIGFATFIAEVAIGVTIITGNYVFMSRLGENGVAAYSIGCYLFPLIFSISNAVAQASQPIVSFNYGAGKTDRVKKALNIALAVASGCGVLIGLGLWAGAQLLTRLFLESDVPAYNMALHGLPLLGVCALFFAINITFIGYYQSIESAGRSIVFMLLRGIVFLIPGFILLPEMLGNDGLWLAIPVAEALTLLVIVAMYIVNRRKSCCR